MSEPDFLTVEDVLALHAESLARFGGGTGIRDQGLLESAVAERRMDKRGLAALLERLAASASGGGPSGR